ncbi:hypothetical protein G9P44_002470 [Scheffersomyces stipitis]|nr:hypothetical protein G9P44_002470 [Scheffersomyces stipitis]
MSTSCYSSDESFTIVNKDGNIISTDEDYASDDYNSDYHNSENDLELPLEESQTTSHYIFQIPRMDVSSTKSLFVKPATAIEVPIVSDEEDSNETEVEHPEEKVETEKELAEDIPRDSNSEKSEIPLEIPKATEEQVPFPSLNPVEHGQFQNSSTNDTLQTSNDLDSYYEAYAQQYIDFMSQNPTTYHVVTHFKSLLTNNGFKYIRENEPFTADEPGFYFTSKDDSTLVAFVVGGKWEPIRGSCFIGSHCDALSVKINPGGSIRKGAEDYSLLGVAPYSGSLNELWLNRDLGLAGSLLVKDPASGKLARKLINSAPHPIGFIPQLAPHFGIEKKYNKQTEMVPIVAYSSDKDLVPTDEEKSSHLYSKYPLSLLRYITTLSGYSLSSIVQMDLDLVDVQPAARGGLGREFIYSSSLDDRLCSFDSVYGLIEFSQSFYGSEDINEYNGLSGIYLANHEEIGSATRTGAAGGFLLDSLRSIVGSRYRTNNAERLLELTNNSVLLSTDVTHALNPNFKDVYLDKNFPLPNTGPSIKFDSNGHVLSDSFAYQFLSSIIQKHVPEIKLQHFHIRNDSRSGGTIGPIMSNASRGLNGAKLIIDVGLPILSMHSIRSIMGYKDAGIGVRFFKQVLSNWQDEVAHLDI